MRRILALTLFASGVARAQVPAAPPAPTPAGPHAPVAELTPAQAIQRSGGSLLRASISSTPGANPSKLASVSYFAVPEPTPRTLKKHDLVTIIVREESESKSEGSTDLKKDASLEAKLEEFIKLQATGGLLTGGGVGDPIPSVKMSGQRDFKGEASVDRTDSLTLRVTAEVIDVKPNGTIVLQARQKIKTDDEEQTFILSGTCRAEDVTPDNTILSTQIFDKDVTKTHKGAVRDTTKRGWMPKLLDVLNPF